MKKLMLSLAFIGIFAFSYAGSSVNRQSIVSPEKCSTMQTMKLIGQLNSPIAKIKFVNCSVTVKGTLSVGIGSVEVSCTASAATCDAASSQAVNCVKSTVANAKKALQSVL